MADYYKSPFTGQQLTDKLNSIDAAVTTTGNNAATATTKASEASSSAADAGTSKNAAASSASDAASSASSAATANTNAGTSATNAANSASAAATSATNAANSATTAANYAATINLPGRIGTTGPASCRNKFHNPLFSIAQRGGSGTVTNSTNRLFDRWATVLTLPGASMTVASSSMTIGGKPRKAMKVTSTVATASLTNDSVAIPFRQCLEGQDLIDMRGDSATIRAYFRASVAGTYAAVLRVQTAYESANRTYAKKFTVAANDITEVLFTVPTDAANWICENSSEVGAWFMIGAVAGTTGQTATTDAWVTGGYIAPTDLTNWLATANATVELCLPQFERGTVASEFDYLPYWLEAQRCFRYLWQIKNDSADNWRTVGPIFWLSSTAGGGLVFLPCPMRAIPTLSYSAISDIYVTWAGISAALTSLGLAYGNSGTEILELSCSNPSGYSPTAGNAGWLRVRYGGGWIRFSAEI